MNEMISKKARLKKKNILIIEIEIDVKKLLLFQRLTEAKKNIKKNKYTRKNLGV